MLNLLLTILMVSQLAAVAQPAPPPGEGPPPDEPPAPPVSKRLKWAPKAADKAMMQRLLEHDLRLLQPGRCTWTPLEDGGSDEAGLKAVRSLLEVDRKRHGACLEIMKQNQTLSNERDVPKELSDTVLAIENACANLATDLALAASLKEGCSPFQVAVNTAPDLRAYATVVKAVNVLAKARMTRGDLQGGANLLLQLARLTQIAVAGSVDMQLALASMNAWMNAGHDLMRHFLQSYGHRASDLDLLTRRLGQLVDSEPSMVGSYLGDGIAMQMQTTLPLFFGPRWKPPVGWNPVMHPPENSARKRPLLTPVGSPQEAMFLYFYTRLKLRDLLAFCQGREGDSVCLEALGRAYQQEVEVMLVTDRWQRFKLARQHWGTLRALNFLLTVDEQNLRLPNLEAMLVDCHRRISSLYHLRFHARVLLGQLGGVEFTNPDQFRSAEWKPFVFERHFGRDTAIALVEKQLQLNSEFPVMAGDHPLIWGFRYEFQVGARFPDPAPSEQ